MANFKGLVAELRNRTKWSQAQHLAQGDTDTAGEAMATYALVTGPTGLLVRAGKEKWSDALDIVNRGINNLTQKHGSYSGWTKEREQFGYPLAFFYLIQSVCLGELMARLSAEFKYSQGA